MFAVKQRLKFVILFGRGGGTHALEFKENVNDVCDLFPSGTLSEI